MSSKIEYVQVDKKKKSGGSPNIILIVILGVMLFLGGFVLGKLDFANRVNIGNILVGDVKSSYNNVNVNLVWEVWDIVDSVYLREDVSGDDLLDGMVRGMVDSLDDPYTAYLNPEETSEYLKSNAGEFEGIGTTLRYDGEFTVIETPIDGYPAQKVGLRSGDKIVEVNGDDVLGIRPYEVAEKIKGKAGTEVEIKVERKGEVKPLEFKIIRKRIDIESVTTKMIEGENGEKVMHIKITQFTESSLGEFRAQWDGAVDSVDRNAPDSVIVDVRNNPGGYVDGVVYVLEDFFGKNTLVLSERDRDGKMHETKTGRNGRLKDYNLIVLVNEGSASASEIFAGAIQDHDRGIVIGMDTVGKGVEQRIVSLTNGGSLHIVFQEWVLPKGRTISEDESITPDIEVDLTDEDFYNKRDPQIDKALEKINY